MVGGEISSYLSNKRKTHEHWSFQTILLSAPSTKKVFLSLFVTLFYFLNILYAYYILIFSSCKSRNTKRTWRDLFIRYTFTDAWQGSLSVQKTKQRVYMFQDDFSVKYPSPHPAIYDQMFFPHLGTINFSQCLKSQEFLILAIASYFLGLKKEKSTN